MSILSSLIREFALPLTLCAAVAGTDGDPKTTLKGALKDTLYGDKELSADENNLLSRQVEAYLDKDSSIIKLVGAENEELAEIHITQAIFHLSELFRLISASKLLD